MSSRSGDPRGRLQQDAAQLMLRCAGYLSDVQRNANGWKTFYAIDIDVIALYLGKPSSYANVFRGAEGDETRGLLARLLGDFLLKELRSHSSDSSSQIGHLFVVPPHDEELAFLINELPLTLYSQKDRAESKLPAVIDRLTREPISDDPEGLAKWLLDNASVLVEAFDGKSGPRFATAQLEALEESRLLNLHRYLEPHSGWSFPVPDLDDRETFVAYAAIFEKWKERLERHKTSKQKSNPIIRDAYVMATLEWINLQIGPQHRQLILVTGTLGILNAAAEYQIGGAAGSSSFGEVYVRHPQAFMAHPSFFAGPSQDVDALEGEAFNLIEWLNLFFPRAIRRGSGKKAVIDVSVLKEMLHGGSARLNQVIALLSKSEFASDEGANFPSSWLNEWGTQVGYATVRRRIETEESSWPARAKECLDVLRMHLANGLGLDELRQLLSHLTVQSLTSLYSSTAWLGLWSQVKPDPDRIKGIPALRFDSGYEQAQSYCQRVVTVMRNGMSESLNEAGQMVDIAEIYSALSKADDSHYHGTLVHALAYATKGHWYATRTLCRLALRAVEGISEEKRGTRKGREASYLLAVAERRLALNVDDLASARHHLALAEARENEGVARDSRFVSESLAIDVAVINFEVFVGKDGSHVKSTLDRLLPIAHDVLETARLDRLELARRWVFQQVLTNIFDLALIYREVHPDLPQPLADIRGLIEIGAGEKLGGWTKWDDLANFMYLVTVAVFSEDAAKRGSARIELEKLHFPVSNPFDAERERVFRNLATSV